MIQLLRMREAKKLQTSELASESIEGGEGRGTTRTEVLPIQERSWSLRHCCGQHTSSLSEW